MIIASTTNPSVHVVKKIFTYSSLTLQEAKKVAFMAFVGVCIIFQAIISDVYVYNKKALTSSPTMSTPTPTTGKINFSSVIPLTP